MVMDRFERTVCQLTGASRATRGDRIQALWGGYGELVRMELDGAAVRQVVVKHATPPVGRRLGQDRRESESSHARKLRSYSVEKHWYEHHATHCDDHCRVPRCLGCRSEGGTWIFVLEDLDATGFSARVNFPSQPEVDRVIEWLAAFHATFLNEKFDGLWPIGSYWHLATRREELDKIREPSLRAAAGRLDAALNTCHARTVIHGDAKIENFCFASSGNPHSPARAMVAAVDFQYVGGGCGMKDVAYFFSSIWDSRDCDAYAADALERYFQALRSELIRRTPHADFASIEREWRRLYPVAWADFQRFLAGWAPGQYDDHPYALRMVGQALDNLGRCR